MISPYIRVYFVFPSQRCGIRKEGVCPIGQPFLVVVYPWSEGGYTGDGHLSNWLAIIAGGGGERE